MPDIAMCKDNNCSKKLFCYRFIARPDKYLQSYFSDMKEDNCKHFLQATKEEIKDYEKRH